MGFLRILFSFPFYEQSPPKQNTGHGGDKLSRGRPPLVLGGAGSFLPVSPMLSFKKKSSI